MAKKEKKIRVYLNANEEVTQEISSSGVLIEHLEDAPRYEINFNYFLGRLISLTKKDIQTNEITKISLIQIVFQKIKYLTEYNYNLRYTINDKNSMIVRNLLENFIV